MISSRVPPSPLASLLKLPASTRLLFHNHVHPARQYATSSSLPNSTPQASRRAVTVANDTGRIPWTQLSTREKAARTTQQSFNLLVVLAGIIMTGGVSYVLYREVFSTDSKTAVFNRVADRVKADARCVELLGGRSGGRDVKAYGEPSWSRWARNRMIASRTETDKLGTEHLYMHFYVEGPLNSGTVNLHMTRRHGEKDFEYRFLAVDVKGHERIYLENADAGKMDKRGQGRMFGVKWW
ncbi:mitochondrial import inner membrane translocase subunit tim21 [Elasticomyces elasticus]|nr:mitochondrial import inner membrane translocase subunit tim21 [Elasticomyces elasticus]KAK4982135.1 mitochondrial import inner membrane translocase subunit tim21 [Elasticomyces elasticus]